MGFVESGAVGNVTQVLRTSKRFKNILLVISLIFFLVAYVAPPCRASTSCAEILKILGATFLATSSLDTVVTLILAGFFEFVFLLPGSIVACVVPFAPLCIGIFLAVRYDWDGVLKVLVPLAAIGWMVASFFVRRIREPLLVPWHYWHALVLVQVQQWFAVHRVIPQ